MIPNLLIVTVVDLIKHNVCIFSLQSSHLQSRRHVEAESTVSFSAQGQLAQGSWAEVTQPEIVLAQTQQDLTNRNTKQIDTESIN